MSKFLDTNFLLASITAQKLYNDFAKNPPIFDYHCHLSPQEIAENKTWKNLTELWLGGDHYKWRAMRTNGISEELITGNAPDFEKFKAFASTIPYCLGNPLYHWSHLELKTYFGIDLLINEENAQEIWDRANDVIQNSDFSAKNIIKRSNVKVICTTDDPTDMLEYHRKIREDKSFDTKVLPAFRPDKGLTIESLNFMSWVQKLEVSDDTKIGSFDDFLTALEKRVRFFHHEGCRVSDHALDKVVFESTDKEEVFTIFDSVLKGNAVSRESGEKFKTYMLVFLAKLYHALGWAMQLHIGALRNTNEKMLNSLGPDTGFDSINDGRTAKKLSMLLNEMDKSGNLPKTILYCLNPSDNEVLATMAGNFQGPETPMKIQFGSGWWFNDQKDGIIKQMTALANLGLLRRFIGMTTDSRSFLSYPRHDYFRRVLCSLIGDWVEKGEVPNDMALLGKMVKEICYENAVNYFNIKI